MGIRQNGGKNVNLESALNVGLTALATEHFFTAFLSSPKASEQFLKPEDVKEMFLWATAVSLSFAVAMAIMLKNLWGLLSTGLLIFVFYLAYRKSMGEKK
jgi:hypothetical protein